MDRIFTLESVYCIEKFLIECDKLTTGQIIAIAVGSAIGFAYCSICILPCIRALNKRKSEQDLPPLNPEDQSEPEEEPERSCLRRLCC